jgi:methionyl aminopeptidase
VVFYKTDEEIEIIRRNCLLVCETLAYMASLIKPGLTGKFLDEKAEEFLKDHGAKPAFKGYNGFPYTLCYSPNDVVVHGFPNGDEIRESDIISIDCGVEKDGFFGDAAYTFIMPNASKESLEVCKVTKECLKLGIEQAVVGKRLGDIGYAVQFHAENRSKMGVVRELVGHGLGRNLHEAPEVCNYGKRGNGMLLKEGLVIAIEPMINRGTQKVKQMKDGWTIKSRDSKPSAHYEHTVAIRKGKADILSNHEIIEIQIKNNQNLSSISINF